MTRSVASDGIRRRGGALFGELRKLELLRESGKMTDGAYRAARARLMRSVADADVVTGAQRREAVARSASNDGGAWAALALGALGLGAVAMVGTTLAALAWIAVAGLAAAALAAACLE